MPVFTNNEQRLIGTVDKKQTASNNHFFYWND